MDQNSGIKINCLSQIFEVEGEFHLTDISEFGTYLSSVSTLAHRNDFYQIFLYLNGNGKHRIDLNSINIQPGILAAASKGQVQTIESGPETEAYLFSFTEQFLYRYEDDLQWLHHLNLFDMLKCNRSVKLNIEGTETLITHINQIKEELRSQNTNLQNDIIRDLFRVFIHRSERLFSDNKTDLQENKNDYDTYFNFRKILELDYKKCRSVKEFAGRVYVTPKKLNQVTLKYNGKHAKKMIEERLIMEIKRLLLYTNMNIKEIAFDTGFNDLTNFVKFFKRHTKVTPAKYPQL